MLRVSNKRNRLEAGRHAHPGSILTVFSANAPDFGADLSDGRHRGQDFARTPTGSQAAAGHAGGPRPGPELIFGRWRSILHIIRWREAPRTQRRGEPVAMKDIPLDRAGRAPVAYARIAVIG